jgi:hypothetical protein
VSSHITTVAAWPIPIGLGATLRKAYTGRSMAETVDMVAMNTEVVNNITKTIAVKACFFRLFWVALSILKDIFIFLLLNFDVPHEALPVFKKVLVLDPLTAEECLNEILLN